MAGRIIRHDFVAGEIAPGLWGREDQDLFYHGAASIENFVPRVTGGVRKRAGTELLWHLAGQAGETRDYRIVPYRFNKDAFGLIALYRKDGSSVYWRFFAHRADGTTADSAAEKQLAFLQVPQSGKGLSALRHIQIGDTIYFTLHGYRAFTARVYFDTMQIDWRQLDTSMEVPAPTSLSGTWHDSTQSGTTQDATRQYALWGVRNGVRSKPKQISVTVKSPWLAGAYVSISFSPDWTKHDYYILGKMQGGAYGEMQRFYVNPTNVSTQYYGGTQTNTGTYDGATWTSACGANGSVLTTWGASNQNATIADGRHKCGAWVLSVGLRTNATTITAVNVWWGAKMRNAGGTVATVAGSASVHIVLYENNASGRILAEWDQTPAYNDGPQTLALETPAKGTAFALHFYTDSSRSTAALVPMRGAVLSADSATKTYKDDNISPGSTVGEQSLLPVGSVGMDVDHVNVWEQRLVAASCEANPFTMWFSAIGDLENFYVDRPQTADNAFEATIASTEANRILHIVAQKWLLVFTESGEYVVSSSSGPLSYASIAIRKTSSIGAHPDIVPVATETEVLFVAADGRSVYRMDYSLEKDSVVPISASVRAQHVTEVHRIVRVAYQRYPDSVLWCLLDDGSLASLTVHPEENVRAWARHRLAGGAGLVVEDVLETGSIRADADTDTTSDLLLVLRDAENAPGDVWVERLRPCVVSDAPGAPAARCIDHAGYASGDLPPGGDPAAPVSASLVTMRLDPPGADLIGKQCNAFDATVRLYRSGAVAIRAEGSDRWATSARQPDAVPAENAETGAVALVRKDVKVAPFALYNRDARLEIRSDDDWPCEILEICAAYTFGTLKSGG